MKILCVFGKHNYGDPARGEGYEHANFLPALRKLGHEPILFESFDRSSYRNFAEMNRAFLQAVERAQPDAILCVLMNYEVWIETLDLVRRQCPAPLINWGTDDSWKYAQFTRFIAPHVDCYATTSADVLAKAKHRGLGNIVLTQWAASDATLVPPISASECRYQVSFVGSAYGNRRRWITKLQRHGIEVECFGHGWPRGPVAASEIPRIVRESAISLNFGDSGLQFTGLKPYRSRQIKARVFEVPGAGGFLLTESAPELSRHFRLGEEVVEFDSVGDLIAKVRHFLEHGEERDRIAQAGHQRTRHEHTYAKRFAHLFEEASRLKAAGAAAMQAPRRHFQFDRADFTKLAARHTRGWWLRVLGSLLAWPAILIWGHERGLRAARRILFELSWRFAGAKTYSAAGLPGRVFYK
jgi:spore maturation protein CgeB